MFRGDLEDLRDIVDAVNCNYNFIEVYGVYDQTYTCIFCRKYSLYSIGDIKHDEDCVSKRLIHLYNVLDEELYRLDTDN